MGAIIIEFLKYFLVMGGIILGGWLSIFQFLHERMSMAIFEICEGICLLCMQFYSCCFFIGGCLILCQNWFTWDWYANALYHLADILEIRYVLIGLVIVLVLYLWEKIIEKIHEKKYYKIICDAWGSFQESEKIFKSDIKPVQTIISDIFAEKVQATDKEIFDEISPEAYEEIKKDDEERKAKIKITLSELFGYKEFGSGLKEMDSALNKKMSNDDIFKMCFKNVVDSGELVILTQLNSGAEEELSWDKNLYKTTRKDINQDNMMETIVIEDID